MNLLYLECNMGAAGDMLMGALYDLLDVEQRQDFLTQMNSLGLPGVTLSASQSQKCGIYGTHMQVSINGTKEGSPASSHAHEHHHTGYNDILQQITRLPLPEPVRAHAAAVYRLIGNAEAKAHQTTIEQIHFHEIGTIDAVTDVVGCCLLIHMLKPDTILAPPVHVGSGTVHCAHGILPVPAPATAEILRGVPVYGGEIEGELCTPTGAALLKHFAESFTGLPFMTITATGYGMGTRDFPQVHCVRAFLGTTNPEMNGTILSLSCNLDDITGEALAFAVEQLMVAGALDVYTTPVFMKKGARPFANLPVQPCRRGTDDRIVLPAHHHPRHPPPGIPTLCAFRKL